MALYSEVVKLQLPELQTGILQTIVTTDQLLAMLPIFDTSPAYQLMYNKESGLGNTTTSGSIIAPDGTFTPNSASYTNVTQLLTYAGASFNLANNLATDVVVAREVYAKSKMVARSMGNLIVNATVAGDVQFNGLSAMYSGSSTHFTAGVSGSLGTYTGSFSLGLLDQALWAVKAGKPNLIVTSTAGHRYFKNALRNASAGANLVSLQQAGYGNGAGDPATLNSGFMYESVPVIASDFITKDANVAGGETLYVLYGNEVDGVKLWSNFSNLVTFIGPVPVPNSLSSNWSIGTSFGMVCPPLAGAMITGITS